MRRASSGKRQTFNVGDSHRSSTSVFHGQRDSLFRVATEIDTSVLDQLTPALEAVIAQRIYKLGIKARDMARRAAPSSSGALRAGIYVTAPSTKVENKEIRKGNLPKQGRMKGHSSGYARAIQSAAVKTAKKNLGSDYVRGDEYVPGKDEDSVVNPRTQRLHVGKNAVTLNQLRELTGQRIEGVSYLGNIGGIDGKTISINSALGALLPFNPLGSVGRSAFYVGIGSAMYYSAWVEFGTSKMKAQPFFTPAADWLVSRAPSEIASAIKEAKF